MQVQKLEWPECVGLPHEEAQKMILQENPNLTIEIIPPDITKLPHNHHVDNRIRLIVNKKGKVCTTPVIG